MISIKRSGRLTGRFGNQRQSVHRVVHIVGQDSINLSLPIDPRFTGKAVRSYFDAKMRFAAFPPAGMAVVFVGLVDDAQQRRLKGLAQLTLKTIGNLAHGTSPDLHVVAASAIVDKWMMINLTTTGPSRRQPGWLRRGARFDKRCGN
jgi:hypothetical protein